MMKKASDGSGGIALLMAASAVFLPRPAAAAAISPPPLWGSLQAGPHAVGFRMIYASDRSRPPLAPPEREAAPSAGQGRPMPLAVWYPARPTDAARMRWSGYVARLGAESDPGPLDAARRAAGGAVLSETLLELGADPKTLAPALEQVGALETAAVENAGPADGRFPIVLFPGWRSPAEQSVMAEYLASHGFVVAGTTLKGTADADPEINAAGIETQVADLRFLLAAARALPMTDGRRYGAMGVGINATSCLALEMRDPELAALVSLDGGIPTAFEDRFLRKGPYYDVAAVRAPMLAIWPPNEPVEPALFEQYRYAPREMAAFSGTSEYYFLSYGALEHFAPAIAGKPPGDVATAFAWAARLVRAFFARSLSGASEDLRALAASAPNGQIRLETKPALPAPPTAAEMKRIFREQGMAGLAALYRERKARDPQPFGARALSVFTTWLSWQRDKDWTARRELANLRVESFPSSARARLALAQAAAARGEKELAAVQFEKALELLAADDDPELDPATRRVVEAAARGGLEAARKTA